LETSWGNLSVIPVIKHKMNLQEEFLKSEGKPIKVGGHEIVQGDRIPIKRGTVRITFIGNISSDGIAIKSKPKRGGIEMSNGKFVRLLHIFDEPSLPRQVQHRVNCPDGELRIWNIYKTKQRDGSVTIDSWTGNAGMIVEYISPNSRRYSCSKGTGNFDPTDLTFEISWTET